MKTSWNDSSAAVSILPWLGALLAAIAIALHSPGHLSMDTSIQLYEASTGRSISWNPPFMSALLRWLGGGEWSTALLVFITSTTTYLALAAAARSSLLGAADSSTRPGWLRLFFCIALLLNPVIFIYVGIVWKDVLFSSLMTAAAALSLLAANASIRPAIVLATLSTGLLAVTLLVRQQGVFMAPVLLLMPIIAVAGYRGWSRKRQALAALLLIGSFVAGLLCIQSLVSASIVDAGNRSRSVGFQAILDFDIAGTLAHSTSSGQNLPVAISASQLDAIRRTYSSRRIDFLATDPEAQSWFKAMTDDQHLQTWRTVIAAQPMAFIEHKWTTFLTILDVDGVEGCIPVHIGVSGNPEYLRAVDISEGMDSRDQSIYTLSRAIDGTFIYRHWFYLLMLAAAVVGLVALRLPRKTRAMASILSMSTALFYLSFLPTAIACDFRYLYGGIPLVSLLWLLLAAQGHWRGDTDTRN